MSALKHLIPPPHPTPPCGQIRSDRNIAAITLCCDVSHKPSEDACSHTDRHTHTHTKEDGSEGERPRLLLQDRDERRQTFYCMDESIVSIDKRASSALTNTLSSTAWERGVEYPR